MSKKKNRERGDDPVAKPDDAGSESGAAAANEPPAPQTPPPEPLTPERVAAENRRNDLFIIAAVLIAAFLFGFFKINDSDLWLHLRTGWQIDQLGIPDKDSFAYTTADQKWINSHWLYDRLLYESELIESRGRVRRLADDYKKLMNARQAPKLDAAGKSVTKPLPVESVQAFDQAVADLTKSADSSDTYAMRLAAERAVRTAKSIGLQMPVLGQTSEQASYRALSRYLGTGGKALISLESLVVIKCLLIVALVGVLLSLRHTGPTAWWTAVVAAATLVAMSDRLTVSPEVFSLVFLAIVFWIVHEFQTRRTWAIWLLVPLELAWVNIDSLFPLGLIVPAVVLACQALGRVLDGSVEASPPRPAGSTPGVLAAAVAAGFVATLGNPYHVQAWSVPLAWTGAMFGRVAMVAAYFVSLFNRESAWAKAILDKGDVVVGHSPDLVPPFSRNYRATEFYSLFGPLLEVPWLPAVTCVVLILAAAMTLVWAARGERVWRAVMLAIAVAMFLVASRYIGVTAIVAGVVLALNGQEWFLRRFGTQARMTNGWLAWSQGGRAATIIGLALVAIVGMTGRFGAGSKSEFGWGILWVKCDLTAGEFLRDAKLSGKMLNTVPLQGNLLIWSNYDPDRPATRVFLDGRLALHRGHLDEFEALKRALRDNERAEWREAIDKLGATHVLLNIHEYADRMTFLRSLEALHGSDDWQLVHLDSTHAILGRTKSREGDPLGVDVARLRELAVSPTEVVYRRHGERMPEPPPPVRPPGFVDWFWRSREFSANESLLAGHLLNPRMASKDLSVPGFVVPTENCFLAIRAAREGLAKRQKVSTQAYRSLSDAYFFLYNTELAQIPVLEAHQLRTMQLICALNQLVAAEPDNKAARVQLAFRYLAAQFFDLADEQLDAAINLMDENEATVVVFEGGEVQKFARDDLIAMSERLKINVDRAQNELAQMGNQLAQPLARMNYLYSRGCPGKAIQDLSESIGMSPSAMELVPHLANLYIRTGQPGDVDRGAEGELKKLQSGAAGLKSGEFEEMFAIVKLLQGDYESAKSFMEKAIAETRHSMAATSLASATVHMRQGELFKVAETAKELVDDAARQARLEFHLGMLQLEAGEPTEAVRHFEQTLLVREDVIYRPVISLYMERITGEKLAPLPDLPSDEKMPVEVELPPKPSVEDGGLKPPGPEPAKNSGTDTKDDAKPAASGEKPADRH